MSRLRWQCRRGSKELDLLLQAYLEKHYLSASVGEKKRFAELLRLDDGALSALLLRSVHAEPVVFWVRDRG